MMMLAFAVGIVTCPSAPVGGALNTCTPAQQCLTALTNDTMVRTLIGGVHQWQKWVTVPPTGTLRACDTIPGSPDRGWTNRALSGVTTISPPPPPPPAQPPAPPTQVESQNVHALWWTPTLRDTANNLIEVTGYRVYQGSAPGTYAPPVSVTGTRYDLSMLTPGTYYFAVSALYNGIESAKSVEIEYVVPSPTPPPPPKVLRCADPSIIDNKTITLTCAFE